MSKRFKEIIEWMDELVSDENRDERILSSVWQLLRSEIEKVEK